MQLELDQHFTIERKLGTGSFATVCVWAVAGGKLAVLADGPAGGARAGAFACAAPPASNPPHLSTVRLRVRAGTRRGGTWTASCTLSK